VLYGCAVSLYLIFLAFICVHESHSVLSPRVVPYEIPLENFIIIF
jgi:hypothetical protein